MGAGGRGNYTAPNAGNANGVNTGNHAAPNTGNDTGTTAGTRSGDFTPTYHYHTVR